MTNVPLSHPLHPMNVILRSQVHHNYNNMDTTELDPVFIHYSLVVLGILALFIISFIIFILYERYG